MHILTTSDRACLVRSHRQFQAGLLAFLLMFSLFINLTGSVMASSPSGTGQLPDRLPELKAPDGRPETSMPKQAPAQTHSVTLSPEVRQLLQQVTQLEQTLYTLTYDNDDLQTRLARLEQSTFGQSRPQLSPDDRIARLKNIVMAPRPRPENYQDQPEEVQNTPTSPAPVLSENHRPQKAGQNTPPAKPSVATNSPDQQLRALETYLLNKSFDKEPLPKRVERLEQNVFKAPQKGSLSARIQKLNTIVLGDTPANNQQQPVTQPAYTATGLLPDPDDVPAPSYQVSHVPPAPGYMQSQPGYIQPPPDYNSYSNPSNTGAQGYNNAGYNPASQPMQAPYSPSNPTAQVPADPNMSVALGKIEQKEFRQTYPLEAVGTRLDRIENKIFQQTSPELNPDERLDRIMAVVAGDGDKAPNSTASKNSGWQALLPFVIMIPLMFL